METSGVTIFPPLNFTEIFGAATFIDEIFINCCFMQ